MIHRHPVAAQPALAPESPSNAAATLPDGFVRLAAVDASILVELRYAGCHNFVGRPLPGYLGTDVVLTEAAAHALADVQRAALARGQTLKVYDAYRPQKAVDEFVRWADDADDCGMKAEFYPRVDKRDLFRLNYIAKRSTHSRGSTVDLTLVPLPVPSQPTWNPGDALLDSTLPLGQRFADNSIDMGTGFDAFDPLSHTACPDIGASARANRDSLLQLMHEQGFVNLYTEWWHYTLRDEPYPDTYFDFDIQ